MRKFQALAALGCALCVGVSANSATAAPLTFDCDAAANRSSSITSPAGPSVRMKSILRAVSLQSGRIMPNAGIVLSSADNANSLGFQISLPAAGAQAFQLLLVGRADGKPIRQAIAEVPIANVIDFEMQVDAAGQGQVRFGTQVAPLRLSNLGLGKATVFCGSGQFRFENLEIVSP